MARSWGDREVFVRAGTWFLGALAVAGLILDAARVTGVLGPLSVVALTLGTAAGGTALWLRGRRSGVRFPGWWLLGAGGAVQAVDLVLDLPHHAAPVLAACLLVAGMLRLPAPTEDRSSLLRTALDAVTAGSAFAVLAGALVELPTTSPAALSRLGAAVPTLAFVALGTAALLTLGRARRGGGLGLVSLTLVSVGVLGIAAFDVLRVLSGTGSVTVARSGLTLCLLALARGALAATPESESPAAARRREHVAVLTPLVPLVGAGAVLLGSLVFGSPLSLVTLTFAVVLGTALTTAAVLTRLESLRMARSLDELVFERTMTLGTREKWFRSLVQNSSDVITVVDPRGVVRYQTPSVRRILGHDPALLVGTRITGLLRPADGRRLEAALASAAREPGRPLALEFPIWHKQGRWCDTETTITSLVHDADIRGLVLNTRDVSERRRLQAQLTQQAYSDPLTGLANRALFRSRVEETLDRAEAPGGVAVLFLDLDGFKAVNDAHGHHVGDELLGIVGKRLLHCVRPGDLVARLGGDEFGVLVTAQDAEEGAIWVAERIRRSLAAPFVLEGRELLLGVSTGIALDDRGVESADQLLRNADLAMYRAKSRPDLGFVRFEARMHDVLVARVKAEADLRQAVSRGELVLHYQPVIDLADGRIVGVEALVRWKHHERGLVLPGEFIALAEETGLVGDIGAWALAESARQGVRWQAYAPTGGHFRVAVNVSARQLSAELPRLVRDALAESGLPGQALTLEMTESVLMDRTEEVIELLNRVKRMGVLVAVDDFGTGYSSLSYLSRFPVDILKIDQSFVAHLDGDCSHEKGALARTIVSLGQSLQLATVAEGIETEQQRDLLTAMGCTYGQGFYFARPMAAEDLDDLLAEQVDRFAVIA